MCRLSCTVKLKVFSNSTLSAFWMDLGPKTCSRPSGLWRKLLAAPIGLWTHEPDETPRVNHSTMHARLSADKRVCLLFHAGIFATPPAWWLIRECMTWRRCRVKQLESFALILPLWHHLKSSSGSGIGVYCLHIYPLLFPRSTFSLRLTCIHQVEV